MINICMLYFWELSSDKSQKVRKVKEVMRSDGLWRFACGDVFMERLGDCPHLPCAALVGPIINYRNGDHYEDNCDNCEVSSGM